MSTFKRIVACFFAVLMMVTSMPVTGLAAIADSAEQAIAEAKSHAIIEEATKEKPETSATKTEISEKTTGNSEETKAEEEYKTQDVEMKKYGSTVSPSNTNIVYGKDGFLTRAEWLHNLAVIFSMEVEEESLPDNYFSDIETSHKYYKDILLTVEFGVVDIEAGGKIRPDDMATRDFAVSTLNFCLGYRLEEGTEYTFGDADTCLDADSAQIAINRGWTPLIGGNFSPAAYLTTVEAEKMVKDAQASVAGQEIDASYENNYVFAEGIIVIPDGTQAFETANGIVNITDCPETIEVGNKFAVYYSGIPVVYTAQKINVVDKVTIIQTQAVDPNEAITQVDAEGVVGSESMSLIPAEGAEVWFEEEAVAPYALKKVSNISGSKTLTLIPGLTATVEIKVKNPRVEYDMKLSRSYVMFKGDTEIKYELKGDVAQAALGEREIKLCDVPIGGIGSFEITVELEFSGAASGVVEGTLNAGVEVTKDEGFRAVKTFKQKYFSSNVEATISAGLMAKLGVTRLPIVEAYIFVEAGLKANLKSTTYSDDTAPKKCVHFAAYLYANYGAVASAEFGPWKKEFKLECEIYNDTNSPIRIVHHYEDGQRVAECTKGTVKMNYFTPSTSKGDNTGWSGGNHSYGLQRDGTPVKLYNYTVDDKGNATLTKYLGNSWTVNIPSTIDGYTVVAIGNEAFYRKSIRNVIVPDTVTFIDSNAFFQCKNLKTIKLSESLTKIGGEAFWECSSLEEIVIPDSVTYISQRAFYCCTSLKKIKLSNNLTYLGYYAFAYSVIEEIDIPKSLDSCGSTGPFAYCNYLKTVRFEEGTTQIAECLFDGCTGLEEIEIPDTVTIIEKNAFFQCKNLKTIKLSESLTKIGGEAFWECSSLEEIVIPDSVTYISQRAFYCCTSLKKIKLSNNLTYLGYYAFAYSVIEEIDIPKSLDSCGSTGPFAYCNYLKTVRFEEGTTQIAECLFDGCTGLEEIEIPDTVTIIEKNAFFQCKNLKTIKLSESLTKIGGEAFWECSSLEEIVIPDSVTYISQRAFYYCTSLKKIKLSNNLTYLGYYAFAYSVIEEIDIPKSLDSCGSTGPFAYCNYLKTVSFEEGTTQIAEYLFEECTGLEEIEIPDTVTTIEQKAFRGCTSLKRIIIPDSVNSIKQHSFQNCTSLENIVIPNSVTSMGTNCFYNCTSLESAVLPNISQNVMERTFYNCTSLKTISLPKTVTTIQPYAFYNCTSLENIIFEEGTTISEIRGNAFEGCVLLKEIILPETVSRVDAYAFKNCTGLEKVYIPQSTKTLNQYAFVGCAALNNVIISDYSITEIGAQTFKDCPALVEITLPKGLKTIGSQAFMNDTSLVKIVIPESVTSINSTAFSYPDKMVIHGKKGSYAETFATENGFKFVDYSIPAEGISLIDGIEKITLERGQTYRAIFEFFPENSTDVITLTTNNNNVTINGHDIYARYTGTSTLTATASSGVDYVFTITIIDANSITIEKEPTKLAYYMGEELDLTGMVVKVNYNDKSSKEVTDYTVSGFDSSAEGECTVTVRWVSANGSTYKKTFKTTIIDPRPKVTGIYVDTLPNKVDYARKESLDLTGMVIKANYTDGTSKVVTEYTVSGYNALKNGVQTVTVTFGGFTTTFNVTVGLTLQSVEIATKPNKTVYYIGEALETKGLTLNATYSDGTVKTIESGFTVSGFSSASVGTKTVKVTFNGMEVSFNVTVKAVKITLSSNSLALTAGETATLTATTAPEGQTVSWKSTNTAVATVENGKVTAVGAGDAKIEATFTYGGITYKASCIVTVTEVKIELVKLTINTLPENGTLYIGDSLNTDGLVLKAEYSDGSTKLVESGFAVNGFDSATAGEKTVVVSYMGKEVTFNVTVNAPSVSITSGADSIIIGEKLTLTATVEPKHLAISWKSSNEKIATVDKGVVTGISVGSVTVTASVSYNGKTYSAEYAITVKTNVIESNAKLTIDNVTAKAGETVEMLFVLGDAPQLKALGIENIIFDETKLELVNGEWLVGDALLASWENETKTGVVALADNKDINGNVFKLTIRVKDNVEECDIDVSCEFIARQKQAAGGEAEVGVEVIKGEVSVRNVLKGDTNSDGFVDSDDAVYLLYNVLFGEDTYPLAQKCDFNADGFVDSDDAIYLLYNILFGEDGYPLH